MAGRVHAGTSRPIDPAARARARGKWTALMLALFVNLLFIAVLVFSVSWQNRKPEAVIGRAVRAATGEQRRRAPTEGRAAVTEPKAEPPPEPKPVPKPPTPIVEKPDTREADIALKAKREAERKAQEQAERERVEQERERRRKAPRRRRRRKSVRRMRARRAATAAQRLETDACAGAARDAAARAGASANRSCVHRPSANRSCARRRTQEARGRAAQAAAGAARNKAQLDWIDKIRSRIRGNINLPPDIPGNPEAIFDVVQLPTGEIIDVKLRKSSGVRAYDEAVQRAILKSSPLPGRYPPICSSATSSCASGRSISSGPLERCFRNDARNRAGAFQQRACFSTIGIAAQLQSARCSTSWRSATV